MACDSQTLIDVAYADGYSRLSDRDLREALVAVACAGGGGAVTGNFSGGQPVVSNPRDGQSAIDTSNGKVWWYYSGGWH